MTTVIQWELHDFEEKEAAARQLGTHNCFVTIALGCPGGVLLALEAHNVNVQEVFAMLAVTELCLSFFIPVVFFQIVIFLCVLFGVCRDLLFPTVISMIVSWPRTEPLAYWACGYTI